MPLCDFKFHYVTTRPSIARYTKSKKRAHFCILQVLYYVQTEFVLSVTRWEMTKE